MLTIGTTRLVAAGLGCLFFLSACANPSIANVNQARLANVPQDAVVLVTRFEGNPSFVEESTDYFVSIIESRTTNNILQASVLRVEGADIRSGGNLVPLEDALTRASEADADVLIMGKVTSYNNGVTLNGFATVRVYDVQSGERIANYHEPSGLLVAYSEHQSVMAAVKRTAEHVADILD